MDETPQIEDYWPALVLLVKQGFSVSKALRKMEIKTDTHYAQSTEIQNLKLRYIRISQSTFSLPNGKCKRDLGAGVLIKEFPANTYVEYEEILENQ
jgi:hypothetical protein